MLFVPMLSKKYDLQESESYDTEWLDDLQQIRYIEKIVPVSSTTCYSVDADALDPSQMVSIRFLSGQDHYINFQTKQFVIPKELPTLRAKVNKVIVHVHGGAFISQSSHNHESYLRRWAKELGIPFFSVDYRLAPKNPYPDPVNDCYQGYYWVMTQASKHLGMDI